MPIALRRSLGAAIVTLCLLAGAAFAAAPLKWAPPTMVNPIVIPITAGNVLVSPMNHPDCILSWPKTKHVGRVQIFNCHNVISIGGWNTIPPVYLSNGKVDTSNTPASRILEVSGATGVVHIEGLLGDASGGAMSDGLDFNSPQATIQIENVRIDGIYGYSDMFHADCIQPFGGVKALRVYNFTCNTGYQGLSIWPVSTSPAGWTADIERTNITSIGPVIWGVHNDGGYLYWPCANSACTNMALTSFSSVYLKPRAGAAFSTTIYSAQSGVLVSTPLVTSTAISFPGLKVVGGVSLGPPPGGDFVPAGAAGVSYVSPGYAQ
jgi:hypothetical protein